jgi:hypothetical protein
VAFDDDRQTLAAGDSGGRVLQHEWVAEKVRHMAKQRKDDRG